MTLKSIKALSSVPLFGGLDEKTLEVVRQAAATRRYAAGEMVFLQGNHCEGLYIIQDGWLKGTITSPLGREQIISLLKPGDVFNEIGFLTDGRNLVTVRALEDSTLWFITRETMLRLMNEQSGFCRAITRNIAEHVLDLMKLVEDLSLRTVKSRMARLLLENAIDNLINRRRWMIQTEMAARLGTVLDVANRTLKSLEDDALISVSRNKIQILDRKRLEELASIEE
jgi:CRP/FNR family transcriptional regulator